MSVSRSSDFRIINISAFRLVLSVLVSDNRLRLRASFVIDKVRLWRIDPTKHFQSEVHNLMVLIERANETNENTMPDRNILAILYEEISKDPREAL